MRVLFDTNVVLDVLTDRQPWSVEAQPLVARVIAGTVEGYVCAITVPTLFYIARRTVGTLQALVVVERTLQTFDVAPVDRVVLEAAVGMAGSDYEDHVQAASAIALRIDVVVTRDAAGFAGTGVRALSPAELEAELSRGPSASNRP
jgi:predicted nucleic acid-binding protein